MYLYLQPTNIKADYVYKTANNDVR